MKRTHKVYKKKIACMFCIPFLLFSGCANRDDNVELPVLEDYDTPSTKEEKKEIRLGIVAQPYGDMFLDTIQPFLAEKGYDVDLVLYDNYNEPNFSLINKEIDINIFQHYKYLNNFKMKYDADLSAITEVPTAPMCAYSLQYESISELPQGAVIAVPEDETNLSRALMMLESAELITLDPNTDKSKATEKNILDNPKEIQVVLREASSLYRLISLYDVIVMNGNFAINEGLDIADALYTELMSDDYINIIAIRTEDIEKEFVKDILEAVYSKEYRDMVTDNNGKYREFQCPRRLLNVE